MTISLKKRTEEKIRSLVQGFMHIAGLCNYGLIACLINRKGIQQMSDLEEFYPIVSLASNETYIALVFDLRDEANPHLQGFQTAMLAKHLAKIPHSKIDGEPELPMLKFTVGDLRKTNAETLLASLNSVNFADITKLRQAYKEPEIYKALTADISLSRK